MDIPAQKQFAVHYSKADSAKFYEIRSMGGTQYH